MTDHPKQVVILAGGKGTRLAPFNTILPKPLMPLGEYSILEIVLRQLNHQGFHEAILATGHLSEIIESFLAPLQKKLSMRLRAVREDSPLGTIAPLRSLSGLTDNFLVMNGDILTTFDYSALLQKHADQHALATLAVGKRHIAIDFGVLQLDPEGAVAAYHEKPSLEHWVSLGIYAFSRKVLDWIPPEGHFDLPDLVQLLLQGNRKIHTSPFDGYWRDIGRWEDYQEAQQDFLEHPERFLTP